MRRRNGPRYPVPANAGRRTEELASARHRRAEQSPCHAPGRARASPSHYRGGVIARPGPGAVLMRIGRTQCVRSRPCARTRGDSTVAIKTLAAAGERES
jgi:hypothetical protein